MHTQPVQPSATQPVNEAVRAITVYEAPITSDDTISDLLSWISLGVATIAFFTSVATFFRGARVERQTRFEKAYGSMLRESLRQLDKELKGLTAFIVYSGRDLETLFDELSGTRTLIEELCLDILSLLSEIDNAKIGGDGWREQFKTAILAAEGFLDSAIDDNAGHFKVFSSNCRFARTEYENAIKHARDKLTALEGKI
ncbi:MAG: hypothetical protein AAF250_12310 [Pseudomonadota bacterium]